MTYQAHKMNTKDDEIRDWVWNAIREQIHREGTHTHTNTREVKQKINESVRKFVSVKIKAIDIGFGIRLYQT